MVKDNFSDKIDTSQLNKLISILKLNNNDPYFLNHDVLMSDFKNDFDSFIFPCILDQSGYVLEDNILEDIVYDISHNKPGIEKLFEEEKLGEDFTKEKSAILGILRQYLLEYNPKSGNIRAFDTKFSSTITVSTDISVEGLDSFYW